MARLLALVLAAAGLAAGCVGYRVPEMGDPEAVIAPPAVPLPPDAAAIAEEILFQVNEARAAVGARPLVSDPALDRAAREYSDELADRGEIGHRSATPGRHTLRERLRAAGASFARAGENLALMQGTPTRVPFLVVQGWLRSPGHRANLLDPHFRYSGLGVTQGPDLKWYVTQVYSGD